MNWLSHRIASTNQHPIGAQYKNISLFFCKHIIARRVYDGTELRNGVTNGQNQAQVKNQKSSPSQEYADGLGVGHVAERRPARSHLVVANGWIALGGVKHGHLAAVVCDGSWGKRDGWRRGVGRSHGG